MKAVIFDMDGVIVDSEIHWLKVDGNFLYNLLPHWNDELQKSIIGMSLYDVHAYLTTEHGLTLSQSEYLDYYRPLASDIYGNKCNLIDGVDELIFKIHEAGYPLAVCSSSPREWIQIVLNRFNFSNIFSVFTGGDQVRGRGKPHPDIYHITCNDLGVSPSETVAIEDSRRGVISAKAAGLKCIGLKHCSEIDQDISIADIIVRSHRELSPEFIKKLFDLNLTQ